MAWIHLLVAGACEVVWAVLLPETKSFSRPVSTLAFGAFLAVSMYGLALATRSIPIGTAYAVWVGIGATGTILYGMTVRGDPVSAAQLVAMVGLVAAIVAVKLTAPAH